ncbi:hypothetical protein B0H14DRAFT_3449464 [Mycena olivaceomarginata]|nr:hypothetical protein B0H14DRAFT_3449464 [Mycena olivaceomarginata]
MNTPRWADNECPCPHQSLPVYKVEAGGARVDMHRLPDLPSALPPTFILYLDDRTSKLCPSLSVIYMLCLCSQYIPCAPEFVDAVPGVDPRGRTLLRCQLVLQVDRLQDVLRRRVRCATSKTIPSHTSLDPRAIGRDHPTSPRRRPPTFCTDSTVCPFLTSIPAPPLLLELALDPRLVYHPNPSPNTTRPTRTRTQSNPIQNPITTIMMMHPPGGTGTSSRKRALSVSVSKQDVRVEDRDRDRWPNGPGCRPPAAPSSPPTLTSAPGTTTRAPATTSTNATETTRAPARSPTRATAPTDTTTTPTRTPTTRSSTVATNINANATPDSTAVSNFAFALPHAPARPVALGTSARTISISAISRTPSRTPSVSSVASSRPFSSFSALHSQAETQTQRQPEMQPYYPEGSAKYCLRDARLGIDFSLPAPPTPPPSDAGTGAQDTIAAGAGASAHTPAVPPLAYAPAAHTLFFSRGNRVYCRSMGTGAGGAGDSGSVGVSVSQVCKLQAQHGQQDSQQPTRLALATSTGAVQVWDVEARRVVCSWGTKGVGAMVWGADGAVLSIGGPKGAIRHYDTRAPQGKVHTEPAQAAPGKAGAKSRQQLTRHQTGVAALAWSADGRLLASGDAGGVVYTWDARAGRAPLDVGEFLQRRKKMQHAQPVSALAWCPWQPKLLASGDAGGTVRFWSVEAANTSSNATAGRLELGSRVVGLHWAPGDGAPWRPRGVLSNALAVHAFPSLRPIASLSLLSSANAAAVCGSVLMLNPTPASGVNAHSSHSANSSHKVVVAVPGEGKLKVYEVWGRRRERELRKRGSEDPAEIAHGPMFLGLTMNILLYGIMITQVYLYTTTYKSDPLYIKLYIAVLMLADTFNTGFMVSYLYESLVVHFNDLTYLAKANWVFATGEQGIIGCMVQLFYAWRIHILTGNIWIVVLICICALTNAFGGLASASAIAFVPQFSHFQEFQVPVICWLLSAAVGDVIITTTLVSFFKKHRTGCSATDTRVDQIIRLTIQTGMITSVCSVIDLGLFLGDSSGMHLLFNLPLAKQLAYEQSERARRMEAEANPTTRARSKQCRCIYLSTAGTFDLPIMAHAQQIECRITSAGVAEILHRLSRLELLAPSIHPSFFSFSLANECTPELPQILLRPECNNNYLGSSQPAMIYGGG